MQQAWLFAGAARSNSGHVPPPPPPAPPPPEGYDAGVRTLCVCVFLLAACGGSKPKAQGRPEEVANAAFEALKAGEIGPIEPHMMTAEEQKKVTGVVLDD